MNKRRRLSQTERLNVYYKCDGHCAYCGCELEYKKMQVDHVKAIELGGRDTVDNMFPACQSCNHYKSRSTLDGFRKMLEDMPNVLMRDSVTYRNAVRFGLVVPQAGPVEFYFERMYKNGYRIKGDSESQEAATTSEQDDCGPQNSAGRNQCRDRAGTKYHKEN